MHNVEDYYRKIEFLHTRALELHRERYKESGSYNETRCQMLLDDIRYLALMIAKSEGDLDTDFGKK